MWFTTSHRGVSLGVATLLVLAGLFMGTIVSAQADDSQFPCTITLKSGDPTGTPVQPPSCVDRSGNDQDEIIIPDVPGVYYGTAADGMGITSGVHNNGGVQSVDIQGDYNDAQGTFVEGPIWTLMYDVAVTAAEAPNGYSVVLGACDKTSGETRLTAYIDNTADATDRFLPEVTVTSYNMTGSGGSVSALRIVDGEERILAVVATSIGVLPGTNTVNFYLGDERTSPVYTENIWVPACGREGIPLGDPGLPSGGKKPTASIRFVHHRARVTMKTLGVLPKSGATHFRIVSNPRHGATRRWHPTYPNGTSHTKVLHRQRHGALVSVWYKEGSNWVRLARKHRR